MDSRPAPSRFEFGNFVVDPSARTIHKGKIRLKLHRQPFDVLLMLLEHPAEVVTREELEAKLWPGTAFVDSEHGLNTAVKKLRRVLGDSADKPRFIETVPRIGYRFIGLVHDQERAKPVARDVESPHMPSPAPPAISADVGMPVSAAMPSGGWPHSRGFWLTISASLVALALIGYLWSSKAGQRGPTASSRVMLAVLPFQNLTGDPAQDYFSDGLTEEMIDQLGRVAPQEIGVIARTTAEQYKNEKDSVERIEQQLGAEYVLEGSVRRDARNVRIAAQLVEAKDQKIIWARQYDRELTSLLALQSEIAGEIADEIQLTLGGTRREVPIDSAGNAPSYEAYDLYLQGRFFLNKRSLDGFALAAKYFQEAIDKYPNYARAYAGLADVYALMSSWDIEPPSIYTPKARAAALKALQLNPNLAEAHTALALIAQNYDWDWQTAEREYRRAIDLEPNYATAHHWYAECLALQGRFNEAFVEIDRARQLDPLSLIISTDRAVFFYFSRRYDRAIEGFRAVQDMQPDFARTQLIIEAYLEKGMDAEALKSASQMTPVDVNDAWGYTQLVEAYGLAGRKPEAERAFSHLQELYSEGKADSNQVASGYLGLGDKERAIEYLQKACEEHTISTAVNVDPIYDPLRKDPRFQELLRKMHFTS
ncbi:MAG TPA: winged helix-turn-helix domain-containing protein [Verrucomicrobiae bacterium]|nr:winged helix-turn-helix domain-containing protein [Verrucomicrobiae bacterium]